MIRARAHRQFSRKTSSYEACPSPRFRRCLSRRVQPYAGSRARYGRQHRRRFGGQHDAPRRPFLHRHRNHLGHRHLERRPSLRNVDEHLRPEPGVLRGNRSHVPRALRGLGDVHQHSLRSGRSLSRVARRRARELLHGWNPIHVSPSLSLRHARVPHRRRLQRRRTVLPVRRGPTPLRIVLSQRGCMSAHGLLREACLAPRWHVARLRRTRARPWVVSEPDRSRRQPWITPRASPGDAVRA
jgi:hypothetical protein